MADSGFRHPDGDELRETLAAGIADGWHIAVVSDPFADRTALLDEVVSAHSGTAERVRLSAHVDDVPDFPDSEMVVVENCQYLFGRRIGGFDILEAVANLLAADDRQFVTGWNRYAWNYLTAARHLDDLFPVAVSVQPLATEGMESVLPTDGVAFAATDETQASGREPVPGPTGPLPERVRSLTRLAGAFDLFGGGDDDPRAAVLDAFDAADIEHPRPAVATDSGE